MLFACIVRFCLFFPSLLICIDDEFNLLSSADSLFTRGDSPQIIIIAVSTAGSILLVLNIILVACYLSRRNKKKAMEEGLLRCCLLSIVTCRLVKI